MTRLLRYLRILALLWAAPALAQGYINPPLWAWAYIPVAAGGTVTTNIISGQWNFNVAATGAITTWTVVFPTTPFDGQTVSISCPTGTVSSLTVSATGGPSGVTVGAGGPTSCTANGGHMATYQYFQSSNTWAFVWYTGGRGGGGCTNSLNFTQACNSQYVGIGLML
jgi:hypothetical protein